MRLHGMGCTISLSAGAEQVSWYAHMSFGPGKPLLLHRGANIPGCEGLGRVLKSPLELERMFLRRISPDLTRLIRYFTIVGRALLPRRHAVRNLVL
jgi:hypothetical protein